MEHSTGELRNAATYGNAQYIFTVVILLCVSLLLVTSATCALNALRRFRYVAFLLVPDIVAGSCLGKLTCYRCTPVVPLLYTERESQAMSKLAQLVDRAKRPRLAAQTVVSVVSRSSHGREISASQQSSVSVCSPTYRPRSTCTCTSTCVAHVVRNAKSTPDASASAAT